MSLLTTVQGHPRWEFTLHTSITHPFIAVIKCLVIQEKEVSYLKQGGAEKGGVNEVGNDENAVAHCQTVF